MAGEPGGILSLPQGYGTLFVAEYGADGSLPVGTEEQPATSADAWSFGPPYPNPSSGQTAIALTLRAPQFFRVSVFDLLGREVAVLRDGTLLPGNHRILWNAEGALASGLYLILARGAAATQSRPVLVVR